MSTVQSPIVGQLWQRIHAYEPRAKFGGSVPDLAHELGHSYHRSWDDSPHDGGYSVHYFRDAHPGLRCHKYAAALDVSFDDPELIRKYTARMVTWAQSGKRTLRVYGLREFAGTTDSKVVVAYDNTARHPFRTYGWDNSHLWHIHLSLCRSYLLSSRLLTIARFFAP